MYIMQTLTDFVVSAAMIVLLGWAVVGTTSLVFVALCGALALVILGCAVADVVSTTNTFLTRARFSTFEKGLLVGCLAAGVTLNALCVVYVADPKPVVYDMAPVTFVVSKDRVLELRVEDAFSVKENDLQKKIVDTDHQKALDLMSVKDPEKAESLVLVAQSNVKE